MTTAVKSSIGSRSLGIGLFILAAWAAGCGPATVRPVSFPDPDVGCPAGHLTWGLQIEDQRATRDAETRMTASVREAIQKSFPGCRWGTQDPDAGTIVIEVHRFSSHLDTGSWEAAVEWTVTARNAAGNTLTQFEVNEEVSRPNYQGSDNEKESLSEAFRKGVERTAKGLTSMSVSDVFRHPQETVAGLEDPAPALAVHPAMPSCGRACVDPVHSNRPGALLERFSQPEDSEDL